MAGAAFGGEVRYHETLSFGAWSVPRKLKNSFPSHRTPESLLQKIIADSVSSAASGRVLSHAKRSHILFNLKAQYCSKERTTPCCCSEALETDPHLLWEPYYVCAPICATSYLKFLYHWCHARRISCPVIWSHSERSTSHEVSELSTFSSLLIFLLSYILITLCCDALSLFLSCYERPSFTPVHNCSNNYN